jgi:hypothetical protein
MTALQVIIKEAKAIRKKSPKMEWKKAVAQASAIYASKHKGKSPVGKKKAAKKVVRKKAAKKRIGTIKKKAAKKVVRKKRITETGILKRIRKVKKDVNKLDTAQQKHMSKLGALSSHTLQSVKSALTRLNEYQTNLDRVKHSISISKSMGWNKIYVDSLKQRKKTLIELIKETKTHIAQLKKHIK